MVNGCRTRVASKVRLLLINKKIKQVYKNGS